MEIKYYYMYLLWLFVVSLTLIVKKDYVFGFIVIGSTIILLTEIKRLEEKIEKFL